MPVFSSFLQKNEAQVGGGRGGSTALSEVRPNTTQRGEAVKDCSFLSFSRVSTPLACHHLHHNTAECSIPLTYVSTRHMLEGR